ncbi:gliding motility-associated C-terminal domain-containing protein [Myroides sp. NP-2]|uniref:T9SS type B sorting domain-containing protein n=1 Tax=Myroides sp. NP-2 TaxID=2759945 RepID=UPI0015FD4DAF|nr:gliding motility-associated C-terminal domain-containing protein [Myroides sp. NP-2]MBB1148784.1 gliding motility-associated C-terminal domain-containing protein [Myroides sp. NP-2]
MKQNYVFLLGIFLLLSTSVYAQYYKNHHIAPAPWQYWSTANQIVIGTLSSDPVNVTLKKSDGTNLTTLTVTVNNPVTYRFAGEANTLTRNVLDTTYDDRGLLVEASEPVLVNLRNIASDASVGWTSLGVENIKGNASLVSFGEEGLGVEFRLGYYRQSTQGLYSNAPVYSVLATEDETEVEVEQATGVTTFTLEAGQSRLFKAPLGAYLKSNKSVVVNVGNWGDTPGLCGPGGINGQDGTFDQIAPVHMLGNRYLVVRGEGTIPNTTQRNQFLGSEQSLIVSTKDNTTVTISSFNAQGAATGATITQVLANAGDYYSFYHGDGINANSSSLIVSDNEVIVYAGTAVECETDISTVLPIGGCAGSINIQTTKFVNYNNGGLPYMGFAIIEHQTEVVYLNEQNIETLTNRTRTPLGNSGLYMITFDRTSIGNPENIILRSDLPLTASLVQQGDGFSMSAFFSSFGQAAQVPVEVKQNENCTVRLESTEDSIEYEWFLNGELIEVTTENFLDVATSGLYSVRIKKDCGWSNRSLPLDVIVKPCTDLSITKAVKSQEDGFAIFVITVKNLDEIFTDPQVMMTDLLPSGYEFVSYTADKGTYDAATGEWTIGALAPQEEVRIEIKVKIKEAGEYLNKATVKGDNIDPHPDNNEAQAIVALGKLAFTKKVVDREYNRIGDKIEYEILVENIGETIVTNIVLTDENADAASLSPSRIAELKPGESQVVVAYHTITVEDFRAKHVINQAKLVAQTSSGAMEQVSDDPTTPERNDPTIATILYQADLHATKDDGIAYYIPGQETTYTITVENKGPGSAVNVEVVDYMPVGVQQMRWSSSLGTTGTGDLIDMLSLLDVGDTVTYEVTLTIPLEHTQAFINVVSVEAADNEDPVEACDTCMDINYQKVFIPKGISPNGDGLNDFLDLSNYNVERLKIYNRLGKLVYKAGKYQKEWYGQSESGNKLLPSGTYFYVMENILNDTYTGWIYLIY